MIYLLHREADDDGTDLVTCPAFPEVTTFAPAGDDKAARQHGLAAVEEAIAARIADGQQIPKPLAQTQAARHNGLSIKLPLMTEMKVQLYIALRNSDVRTRAELARRMNKPREQIDRLFRLDHASRTDQIESAFRALDKDIELQIN